MKKFNEFINEGIRDKMTPVPDNKIKDGIEKIFDYLIDKTMKDEYTDEKVAVEWFWNHKYDDIVDAAMDGWTKEEIYDDYGGKLEDWFDDEDDPEDDGYKSYNQSF